MPRINLLPVRALARREQAKGELVVAAVGNAILVALVVVAYQVASHRIEQLAAQAVSAKGEIAALADEVGKAQALKAKSTALGVKLAAIDKLRGQKHGPAPLLAFLSDALGDLPRVWLTALNQQGESLALEGGAMTQGDISAFQLALTEHAPELTQVALALVTHAHGEGADYLQWKITCVAPSPGEAAP